MGWTKRPDYFRAAKNQLAAKRELIKDAMKGMYALEEDFVRVLMWSHLFDYYACCERLGNGLRDASIKREMGVSINSKPLDTTKLVLQLLSYEDELTFERPKCGQ